MEVLVEGYEHRTGEHCASTALNNLLRFHGVEISEPMIVGLAGGLGFYYLRNDQMSPTRIFHGRTATLETDFCRNAGIPFEKREDPNDERAWTVVREQLDRGTPVLLFTDTFYLPYHNTTSHFPGHSVVAVGYDAAAEKVFLADRKFADYQTCSLKELRRARNADDYPQSCLNQYGDFQGAMRPSVPLERAIRVALLRNCEGMLTPSTDTLSGTGAMRALAADFPSWRQLDDWSWAARFGYQVVVKRGAGGSFFRSLYAAFLDEAVEHVPALGSAGLPREMDAIAARWRDLAGILKQQSERESCDPGLFAEAGTVMAELAQAEETFFQGLRPLVAD